MANEISIEILEKSRTTVKIFISSEPVESDTIASIKIYSKYTTENHEANEVVYEKIVDVSSGESLEWINEINGLKAGEIYNVLCDIDSWSNTVEFTMDSGFGISVIKKTSNSAYIEVYGPPSTLVEAVDFWVRENANTDNVVFYEGIKLEPGSDLWGLYTVNGLSPNTEYIAIVDYGDGYGTRYETTFKTYSNGEIGSTGCKVTLVETTTRTANFELENNSGSSKENTRFQVYLKDAPNIKRFQDTVNVTVSARLGSVGEFGFTNLISNTTYILKAIDLDSDFEMEFTTEEYSGYFLEEDTEVITSSSVGATSSSNIRDYIGMSFDWSWEIYEVETGKRIDWNSDSSKKCAFYNLKAKTKYLIILGWTTVISPISGADTTYYVSIYITTLPSEKFSWTYAGLKIGDDGSYKPVLGDVKGADGATYLYVTATEWNAFLDKINEVREYCGLETVTFQKALAYQLNNRNVVTKNEVEINGIDSRCLITFDKMRAAAEAIIGGKSISGIPASISDADMELIDIKEGGRLSAAFLNTIVKVLNSI